MKKEFKLSDKWIWSNNLDYQYSSKAIKVYPEEKVKEFIGLLKGGSEEYPNIDYIQLSEWIDKLTGDLK